EGRGASALAGSVAMMIAQISSLGLGSANTYLEAGRVRTASALLGNTLVVGVGGGGLAAIAAGAILAAVPRAPTLTGMLRVATLVAVPVFLTYILLLALILGRERFGVYNAAELLVAAVTMAWVLGGAAAGVLTPVGGVTANVVGSALGIGLLLRSLLATARPSPEWPAFVQSVRLGLRSHAIAVLDHVLARADLVLVSGALGAVAAGHYAVVQSFAALLLALPTVVATVVFPRLSSTHDHAA